LIAAATDSTSGAAMGLLTVMLDDPTGYGRIVRDAQGRVERYVEAKDANETERGIREGDTGVMAVPVEYYVAGSEICVMPMLSASII
jgi:bifunctional N-acetylglucosamine-1-phosphate-uridyltransferase/glucosamine-1-phosphate-acetyltransferase GlmU-like protein